MAETTMKGRRIMGGVRPSRPVEEDRVCAHGGCDTKLSRYNKREFCYPHAPVKFPRVRGRIVADGTT
ncbi:MAG: hypothetical protein OEO77_05605 [Acidimicrobiia bacterium]|nr:hypothetical protein [Acidimicrobiia bacterium]